MRTERPRLACPSCESINPNLCETTWLADKNPNLKPKTICKEPKPKRLSPRPLHPGDPKPPKPPYA